MVGTTPGGRKQVIPLRIYRMRKQWTLVSGGGGEDQVRVLGLPFSSCVA